MLLISKFEIQGLFGYRNIRIDFKNPYLILIGENGYGKTTILNCLNYVLCGDYKKLCTIDFDQISIHVNGERYSFSKEQLKDYTSYYCKRDNVKSIASLFKEKVSSKDYDDFITAIEENRNNDARTIYDKTEGMKGIPFSIVRAEVYHFHERYKRIEVFELLNSAIKVLNCKILYYPTYRRIEANFSSIFNSTQKDFYHQSNRELTSSGNLKDKDIQFGMSDVEEIITDICDKISISSLNGFANLSADMISILTKSNRKNVKKSNLDINQIRIVLGRIGSSLSEEDKENLLSRIEHNDQSIFNNPYLSYFLNQLVEVYKTQEKYDSAIKRFKDICNKYLVDKAFYYDEINVKLRLYRVINGKTIRDDEHEVLLNNLSSGEKQIVSIFSKIYLQCDDSFIILFDEPELSLSIFWQENIIPDILSSGQCHFLLAVTHSPFIFKKDELKKYVVGLREFAVN